MRRLKDFALVAGVLGCLLPVFAQEEAEQLSPQELAAQTEKKYTEALLQVGYTDFARTVAEEAKRRYPASKQEFDALLVDVDLAEGKFEEVQKVIKARPDQNSIDTWNMKLRMANYYLSYEKYKECEDLYKEYFKIFAKPDKASQAAFITACYSYVQVLQRLGRSSEALDYYRKILQQKVPSNVKRNVQAEVLNQLLVMADTETDKAKQKKLLDEANGIVNDMVWVQDNFFGDAIVGMAHVKMLQGDIAGAQRIVSDYAEDLLKIHESLREQDPDGSRGILRMSPMPACRYLLAKLLYDEVSRELAKGDKRNDDRVKNLFLGERSPQTGKRNGQGAYNHAINVYVNYPESIYAAQAGELAEKIQAQIQELYNAKIGAKITPEQKARVRRQAFVRANALFSENKYEEAATAYSEVISASGMTPEAIPAMGSMIECYLRLGLKNGKKMDPIYQLYADTVTLQLAEGCSGVAEIATSAGTELQNIATFYEEKLKDSKKASDVLDLFFKFYPDHPRASILAMERAKKMVEEKDYHGAMRIYKRIAESSKMIQLKQTAYFALIDMVRPAPGGVMPDPDQEIAYAQAIEKLFDGVARPGYVMALAKYRYADGLRHKADALRVELRNQDRAPVAKEPAAEGAAKPDAADTPAAPAESLSLEEQVAKYYKDAALEFRKLVAVLQKPDNEYQSTRDEKAKNDIILEGALFQSGLCLLSIPANPETTKKFQDAALQAFSDYLAKYPKGQYAPPALLQVGTLYTAQGKAEEAQKQLDRLAKEYPDSDAARNSIPMLAESLFKMGMRSQGLAKYKQMLESKGSYSLGQYAVAAEKLYEAKEYELTQEACSKILSMDGSRAYQPQIMLLQVRTLLALKKPAEAYAMVTALLKDYGGTVVAVDANLALIDVVGDMIEIEKDAAKRNLMIGEVKNAVRFIKRYREEAKEPSADLDLAVARVAAKCYQAEKAMKLPDADLADSWGVAVIAYDVTLSSGDSEKAVCAPYVEDAYWELMNLFLDRKSKDNYQEIVKKGEEYLARFPTGKYTTQVNNLVTQAKIQIGE